MKQCCMPGCSSTLSQKTPKLVFYSIPSEKTNGLVDPLKLRRRREWLRAINAAEGKVKNARVCSKHFVTGRPATNGSVYHVDWVPSVNVAPKIGDESVQNIINNLPEIKEEFDVPEYVSISNEKKIEEKMLHQYITNPVCDENGDYRNDHDYLGLPLIRQKTDLTYKKIPNKDHNYSINDAPACLYTDLRHFCNICQFNNVNLFNFNTHMMFHTMNNDVTCFMCKEKFLTTTCLNNHISQHTTICDICGTEVPAVQIKAHQKALKEQKKTLNTVSNREKVNFCIFCMKEFEKKSAYLLHLSKHKIVKIKRQVMRGPSPEIEIVRNDEIRVEIEA